MAVGQPGSAINGSRRERCDPFLLLAIRIDDADLIRVEEISSGVGQPAAVGRPLGILNVLDGGNLARSRAVSISNVYRFTGSYIGEPFAVRGGRRVASVFNDLARRPS
jgi:hypothetical protein